MKAVWYTRQGPPHEVLQFGERPEPHAGAGEVRVKLHASGINPADVYRRAGQNFPAMTAYCAIARGGELQDRTVFVSGGAGAVGHYAVQWAKRFGARVVTTVSSNEKATHATAAGADLTVNYRTEDVGAALREFSGGKGLSHAVDLDFGVNVAMLVPQMAANGSIAYYATKGNLKPVFPADDFMRRNLTLYGMVLNGAPLELRRRAQNDIVRWLEEGKRDGGMKHTVSAVFPLARTADAHQTVEAGGKRGTVVVECSS